jgi:cell division protease FtsH
VIYRPLMWNVSERIILIESQGKQHAYLPQRHGNQDLQRQGRHRPWGGKLAFMPRGEVGREGSRHARTPGPAILPAPARSPRKDGWKAGVSGVLSAALTLGLLGFLSSVQLKGQFKSLKFVEPAQVSGSIDDLVGMDDIKAEVAQIKDQYQRRADYAEYGITSRST